MDMVPSATVGAAADRAFLGDGGEMGALIRAYDWAASSLGPPQDWPQSLKTAVRLMLTSRHPMFIWWGPELIQFYNDAYGETMGPERHPGALGDRGRDCWAEIWPLIGPQIEFVMRGEGSTWNEDQLVPITRHGGLQQVWWTYGYSPIDDEGGVGGVLVICNDVTGEHLAREALERANAELLGDVDRLRSLFSQAPGFIAVLRGPDHVFEFCNAAYNRLVGRADLMGQPVRAVIPEVEGQGFFDLLDAVFASGEAHVGVGVPISLRPDPKAPGRLQYLDFVYQPIRDAEGAVTGIFVEGYDVTERFLAEERRKLLAEEMNHRVKNTLAIVQSLAVLTRRSAESVDGYHRILTARIGAMAKTQDLLLRGASRGARVDEVLSAELAPYLGDGEQIELACEPLDLAPQAAVNLGLLVHELLTNAAKYGALSTARGRLSVRCARTPHGATLIWRERSERPVPAGGPPGFGARLIERLARDLGGSINMALQPGGLEATLTFSLPGPA